MPEKNKEEYHLEGVPLPETPEPGSKPKPWEKTRVIGRTAPRVDAYERVSGSAVFPSDIRLPGTLYGAILGSPYPHARVKKIDSSAAAKMPGVFAVLDASDPAADLKWPYAPGFEKKLFDPLCRFEGEAVAAVAARSPYEAHDALRAIKVEYEILPFVVEESRALEAGAPPVHPEGNQVQTQKYERGDVAKGLAEADVVLEESYRTECELPTPMELHGCVAKWDGDQLTLWESTQGVYRVQDRVAQILGLPLSKVRVICPYVGGGFGSKLQPGKYTVIAALLARKTGRPVKIFLTREETLLCAGNRPASTMQIKAGIKKDGALTALDFSCLGSGGAYPAGGTALVDWLVRDLYLCPNVRTVSTDVFIHGGPARPFRAPGHPQGSWALEQMLDALAEAIRMDPVELRLKNIPAYSQAREGNPPYTTSGLRRCIEDGARAFGWKEARQKKPGEPKGDWVRGVGMAGALWVSGAGGPPSTVIVKFFADGSANLNMGASDIGTGTKTVMAMVVAEELGVKPEKIQIEHADTGSTQYATPSGGSKTVPTEAPTVRLAAVQVKQQLLKAAAQELKTEVSSLAYGGEEIFFREEPSRKIKVTALAELKKQGVVVGIGYRGPNPENKVINPFAAQFCEVEVNLKTGEVRLTRFLGAHESGRVLNRLTFDSQAFGGIVMGIGLALTESRIFDRNQTGKMVNKNWHDYKLPTALDVPAEMISLAIDLPDEEANAAGAKGLGEPVTIPTAGAIANAVYHATGIRVTQTPIGPVKLSSLLAKARKEG